MASLSEFDASAYSVLFCVRKEACLMKRKVVCRKMKKQADFCFRWR
ncbi:unnamed protein product [Arabidopsis halleri]